MFLRSHFRGNFDLPAAAELEPEVVSHQFIPHPETFSSCLRSTKSNLKLSLWHLTCCSSLVLEAEVWGRSPKFDVILASLFSRQQ